MKVAVLENSRTIICKDVPTPIPGPDEVLVQVAYCGVCGSDIVRYLEGRVHAFPLILGHEFSGIIIEVGLDIDAELVGKKVACVPLVPCMQCDACLSGNYSLCNNYGFIGSRQDGAFAEYVVLPAQNVYLLPDTFDLLSAVFFEPATVAQHAVNLVNPREQSTAAVLGCGNIGIFVAQILQSMGLQVHAFARSDQRIHAARSAGVKNLVDTSVEGWQSACVANLIHGGFNYIFDSSGNDHLMVQAFGLAAPRATVCYIGTPKKEITFSVTDWELLNRKELTVLGSWMSYSAPFPGIEWQQVLERFTKNEIRVVKKMIDTVYSLDTIAEGMKKLGVPNSVSGKLLINCQQEGDYCAPCSRDCDEK